MEQIHPTQELPEGRLDVTFESEGRRQWLDVAIVSVSTTNAREAGRRSRLDGVAARDAEADKRHKYRGLATPFVMEALGRPGASSRGIIGRYATDKGMGASMDAAAAWQSISAIIQGETADIEFKACGWQPAERNTAIFTFAG